MTQASSSGDEIRAAGGIVRREGAGGVEVLVVHRPRYDDWSLPKGKLDPGESFEAAARREVQEETGVLARLGKELEAVRYRDKKGRAKVVRYWLMDVEDAVAFVPNDEVDEIRWLAPAAAADLLTYGRDADLVRSAGL